MNFLNLNQQIPRFELNSICVDETLEILKKEEFVQNENNLATKNKFLQRDDKYKDITREILKEVNSFTNEYYSFDVRMLQMWGNCSVKGMWHHRHIHRFSFISSIICLTDSDAHIWFSTPNMWNMHNFNPWAIVGFEIREDLVDSITKIPTKKTEMIAFPSWLDHSVDTHSLDRPRYTLSCNFFPVGDFGDASQAIYLNLKED